MKNNNATSSLKRGASLDFLRGGGEMGALMRTHDWSTSSLGSPTHWPQPLRTVVRLMLNTGHPMYIWWGEAGACLYNDAYRESIGPERHPGSLGRPAREVWDEIWPIIGPQIDQVMSGRGGTWNVDHLVPITRHGRREDVYWTYSYSPIDDESSPNGIGGILVVCNETTRQVQTAHRLAVERDQLAQLFEQAPAFMALLRGPEHRIEIANPGYMKLVGHRPVLGRTVAEALPEAVVQGYVELLDQVFASGQAYVANGAKYAVQVAPAAPMVERFVDFVYQPIFGGNGKVDGIFVEGFDVTEKWQAQEALRLSQERLKEGLAAARMAVWDWAIDTNEVVFSENATEIFGADLQSLRHPWQVVLPDDLASLHDIQENAIRSKEPYLATVRILRPDTGKIGWIEIYGKPHFNQHGDLVSLSGITLDVTLRKHAEANLKEGERARQSAEERAREAAERLALAIGAAELGTFYCPIPMDKIYWNATCKKHFFLQEDAEVDFDVFYSRLHPDDRERTRDAVNAAVFNREDYDIEYRTVAPDGRSRWIRAKGRGYYAPDGIPIRFDGITIDITRHKQAEENLLRASRQKDDFLAMLAHELRNPLAPISAAAALLMMPGADQTRIKRTGDIVARQVKHMAELLDDLLDVSRVTRGMVELKKSAVDIKTIMSSANEQVQPLIEARRHRMEIRLPSDAAYVMGDEKRLVQVVVNLLTNAARYTPEKGVIEMSLETDDEHVVMAIKDNGIGMPDDLVGRVFDLFVQGERSPDRQQGGLGLGLALVKSLVDLHGGKVFAQSSGIGYGSQFTVQLPRYKADDPMQNREFRSPVLRTSLLSRKIMVVDDNADAAAAIAMVLEAMGHEVHVENNALSALSHAPVMKPDIFLLDIGMPDMNGNELAARLRAHPALRQAVLIAVSGYAQEQDRNVSAAAGFDYHFAKPLEMEKLVAIADVTRADER